MNIAPLIFDIVLVVVFAVCVYNGGRNGFLRAIASLLVSVLALAGAGYATMSFAPVVSDQYVNPAITSTLQTQLKNNISESTLETVDMLISNTENIFSTFSNMWEKDDETKVEAKEEVTDNENTDEENPKNTNDLVAYISTAVGNAVTSVLMFIVLFALLLAILRVLIDKLRFVNKIPIIGPLNMLLGAVLGAITGVLILGIPLWLIVNVLPGVFKVTSILDPQILENSYVLSFVMKYLPQ